MIKANSPFNVLAAPADAPRKAAATFSMQHAKLGGVVRMQLNHGHRTAEMCAELRVTEAGGVQRVVHLGAAVVSRNDRLRCVRDPTVVVCWAWFV